jgi:hypothetical protein
MFSKLKLGSAERKELLFKKGHLVFVEKKSDT